MKIIVGLGNPGSKYAFTRHNLGFMALDALLEKFEPAEKTVWEPASFARQGLVGTKEMALIKQINFNGTPLLLMRPTTFMNTSGFAVSKVLNYYKIDPTQMIVIHDDSDLPLGKIRVRFGGASGGHRGVQSIIDVLSTDKFLRVRLGIGRPKKISNFKFQISNLDRYVLAPFEPKDRNEIKHMTKEATRAIELILKRGIEVYMSKYNK